MSDRDYKISHVGISQVCQRCGVEVGSRSIHDAWHFKLEAQNKEASK